VRFWAPRAVEPCGAVYHPAWGGARERLPALVPDRFEKQLVRERVRVGGRHPRWRWVCDGCGERVDRVYWPLPAWTIPAALQTAANERWRDAVGETADAALRCRSCVGLVYESSERRWGRRANSGREARSASIAWDRFVRRMTCGQVHGDAVPRDGINWEHADSPRRKTGTTDEHR